MKLKPSSIAAALLALCLPASLHAGEMHVEIKVKNNTDRYFTLWSFNGDDSICLYPRQTKGVARGETKSIKCEGKGKHRCKLGVEYDKDNGKNANKKWCDNPARDNSNCTISGADGDFKLSCD